MEHLSVVQYGTTGAQGCPQKPQWTQTQWKDLKSRPMLPILRADWASPESHGDGFHLKIQGGKQTCHGSSIIFPVKRSLGIG